MRSYTCGRCATPNDYADKGKLPKWCPDCRPYVEAEQRGRRDPTIPIDGVPTRPCEDCGITLYLAASRKGNKIQHCLPCQYKRGHSRRYPTRRQPRTASPTQLLAASVVDLRLCVEAAKPLLRVAIMRESWPLVAEALTELEGSDRVVDLRAQVYA